MKKRKWLLLTASVLCLSAAFFSMPFTAFAEEDAALREAEAANAFRNSSDGTVVSDNALPAEWVYGQDDIISYTYRPEHGDTAFYALYKEGQLADEFAAVYIGDTAVFYSAENGEADLQSPLTVNSLNGYLKNLAVGDYTLTVSVPTGVAPATHSHWWDTDGEVSCGITYAAATLTNSFKVTRFEINDDNFGTQIKYKLLTNEMLYTGEADNVPQIELTLVTGEGQTVLEEGVDYTLSSSSVSAGNADLTITGTGGFTGAVTVADAYKIVKGENSFESDIYVVRWKFGEYDREINLLTATAKWGEAYFAVATDTNPEPSRTYVDGLDEIYLTDGMVSPAVADLLNKLDANKTYYLYAKVDGNDNYYSTEDYTQFEILEIKNTWTTTPNLVGWEWHGFDKAVNKITAVPAFGGNVQYTIYTKAADDTYTAIKFNGEETFALEQDGSIPKTVADALAEFDAGTYYLFASVKSDSGNYTSINENFSVQALVGFRVLQARNYWMQLPKLSNWSYGGYDKNVNVISATSAHGGNIKYSIYKQVDEKFGVLGFGGVTSFEIGADGTVPQAVADGLKTLGAGKYYLRATVKGTDNYTGLYETVADFSTLPSFEVIKAENYWSTAPAITAWAEGNYDNDANLPAAAAHYGAAKIVITDVNDETNVVYDSENEINKLAEAGVGAYILTATVEGTDNYTELNFDTIFHVFVPETAQVGIPWWLVLIIVVCSIGMLVAIFWLLHEKGVLQLMTGKMLVAMRTKATMDATIAAVKANKVAEEAKETVRLAEELDRLEAEKTETEENDSDDESAAVLVGHDEEHGLAIVVRYQKPFSVKLIQAPDETKDYFSQLKNVLLSYKKIKSKTSNGYDAFYKGRTKVAKLVIRGKTLCLYLALNPDDYAETKYKVERSESKKFADVPCLYRIKSERRLKYAEELIAEMCGKLSLEQGEILNVDYRPPYESTEQLIEKGLIKKVVYKEKYDDFIRKHKGAAASGEFSDKAAGNSETQAQETAAAEDNKVSDESGTNAASDNSTDDNKTNQGEK